MAYKCKGFNMIFIPEQENIELKIVLYVNKTRFSKSFKFEMNSSSSSYSRHMKNESDTSNRSSLKSVEVEKHSKIQKKKIVKKRQRIKEIHQPPLHFDFNFNLHSSSSHPKEVLSISGDAISPQRPKSVYNSSVTSKRNDSMSVTSAKSRISQNINSNSNIVRLPPPSKPNFIRKSQETIVKANFDDRWQLFLELKTLDEARNRIYFKVYFYKWKIASSTRFIERIRIKTANFESSQSSDSIIQVKEKVQNVSNDDAVYLINKARKKYDEYTSFLSEFEGQVSNFLQIPNQTKNDNNKINDNINKIRSINGINNQENNEINYIGSNDRNIINNSKFESNNIDNNNSYYNQNTSQRRNVNSNKTYLFSKNENEEDNYSAFFNEFDNNSVLVEKKLISEANRNKNISNQVLRDQQDSQLCEFDFTDSSDNLLKIETPPPSNPNSFVEPRPPSENSESGEIPQSEVQISTDSITVANSFCDMVDNSIIKSKELAVKTKMVLADESQSSSDVESEIKDHSFIHEKKRRYISSSSSEEEDGFLPRMMIRYMKTHDSSNSLADSFHVSRSSFDDEFGEGKKKFSMGFPSDLYEEILGPIPVTQKKMPKKSK